MDYRASLEIDDGGLIYMQLLGINREDPAAPILDKNQPGEYGDRYYMVTPRFETGDERYAWINGLVCVGEGKPAAAGVSHRIYAVVNG